MGIDPILRRKGFSGKFAAACRRGVKIERNRLSDSRFIRKMCFLCLENIKIWRRDCVFIKYFLSEV